MDTGDWPDPTFEPEGAARADDDSGDGRPNAADARHGPTRLLNGPAGRPEVATDLAEEPPPASGEVEFDSIEEVDAVARSLRRVGIEHAFVFLALLLAIPVLSKLSAWWFARPVWGGLTLNFLALAALLHVAFVVIAVAYTRFADHIEDEMLGRPEDEAMGLPDDAVAGWSQERLDA